MVTPTLKKMRITVDGKMYEVVVEMLSDQVAANVGGPGLSAVPSAPAPVAAPPPAPPAAAPAPAAAPSAARPAANAPGAVTSPLAGTVVNVHVKVGQAVQAGELLVTLEAMKMNTPIRAPAAGTVRELHATPGATVDEGAVVAVVG